MLSAGAGQQQPAGLSVLDAEGAETGNAHFFICCKPIGNASQNSIQRQLRRHGGGGATQLLAHEFLEPLAVHEGRVNPGCYSCG